MLASPDETILVYDDMGGRVPMRKMRKGREKERADFTDFGEVWD